MLIENYHSRGLNSPIVLSVPHCMLYPHCTFVSLHLYRASALTCSIWLLVHACPSLLSSISSAASLSTALPEMPGLLWLWGCCTPGGGIYTTLRYAARESSMCSLSITGLWPFSLNRDTPAEWSALKLRVSVSINSTWVYGYCHFKWIILFWCVWLAMFVPFLIQIPLKTRCDERNL